MKIRLIGVLCLSAWGVMPMVVHAGTITTYSDRTTFNSNVSGTLTVEDFTSTSHYPISTGTLNSSTNLPGIGITPGLIQAGVTYSTPLGTGNFFNIDAGGGFSGGLLDRLGEVAPLTISFDNPTSAFGFDTNGLMAPEFNVTIHFSSDPNTTLTSTIGQFSPLQFFGFLSNSADISSVDIQSTNSSFSFALDNFTFVASPVPVPAAAWLFGSALLGMLGIGRRKA